MTAPVVPPTPNAWPAPAKLNLFLHVTGRRPDGYHELQTVFQLVDLCDWLTIRPRTDGAILRPAGAAGVAPEDDLVVRAARRLRARAGRAELGAEIAVAKHVPLGGGLGGGSSDAATVLVALNRLWGVDLTEDELAAIGLELGADVPVFVHGRSAHARGVGEALEPVDLAPAWYAVVHPGVAVATGPVFQAPELTRNSPVVTIAGSFSTGWPGRPLPGRNDLEPVVVARHAPVREALAWLARRCESRLTGSGACVFGAFESEHAARRALDGLPREWTGWVVAGLARSPLHERLERERR